MTRQVSKPNIFWAPSLKTARKIDDEDTVKSIETARFDGGLKGDQRMDDPTLQPPLGQLGEEALDGVQPGGGVKWKTKPGMPPEPPHDLGVFVGQAKPCP